MAPCLICYFVVILFYIQRKWLLMRNLARMLHLKSKLSEKFQCFNAIMEVSKYWKKVEFTKISIKMKNCKTFYETQKTRGINEITQTPPNPPRNRNKQTFAFKMLQECSFGRQETVECKCLFWHQTETWLFENF